jgi:CBS domain-containing protein
MAPTVVALQIDAATTVAALRPAAAAIDERVQRLQADGARVDAIAAEVSALNTRLFARLWALLAPAAVVAHSALLVMGSEGRGEQILKTDQDNGLILRDGVALEGLEPLAARFSEALATFGYPPCPGDIMVTNPLWRQPLAGFRASIRHWLLGGDPEGPMRLAIFCDAACVAGDAALLEEAKAFLDGLISDNDAYLARFAGAADQFHEPHDWLAWVPFIGSRRESPPLDLKKLGIFPIVHGVRALALQYRVHALGTAARLEAIVQRRGIEPALAADLLGALHRLMALRLAHQVRQRAAGLPAGNEVRPSALAPSEGESLQQALAVVRRFRTFLRQHFRFDNFR